MEIRWEFFTQQYSGLNRQFVAVLLSPAKKNEDMWINMMQPWIF